MIRASLIATIAAILTCAPSLDGSREAGIYVSEFPGTDSDSIDAAISAATEQWNKQGGWIKQCGADLIPIIMETRTYVLDRPIVLTFNSAIFGYGTTIVAPPGEPAITCCIRNEAEK